MTTPTDRAQPTRRRLLGQYYTPDEVVHLAFDLLEATETDPPRARRMIDPACGEGAFLRTALDRGLVRAGHCVGLDRDAATEAAWDDLRARGAAMIVHDGLYAAGAAAERAPDGAFDWVVGNPPYSGAKLRELETLKQDDAPEALRLLALHLREKYVLWRYGRAANRSLPLPDEDGPQRPLTSAELRRLATFPPELLFLERFIQLARPGGRIAIVLPDGVLANARLRHSRAWALERLTLETVIALPPETFRASGTKANTALVIARRQPAPPEHEVMFATLGSLPNAERRAELVQAWRERNAGAS